MNNMNLMLHCGAELVDRDSAVLRRVPEPMGRHHHPIPHIELINTVEQTLNFNNLSIVQAQYGALKDGSRMFGLIEVRNGSTAEDYTTVVGLRASHDQSLAAGIVAGSGVFVCDNLCFSGEVKVGTKQTTHIYDRLFDLVHDAVSRTAVMIQRQHDRFDAYKDFRIKPRVGDAAIVELVRRKAINPSQAGRVIEEWDTPSYPEFEESGHSVWRLHNAVTEVYKPTNGHTNMALLPGRSQALTGFCDEVAGVNW